MVQQFSIRFHKNDLLDVLSGLFGSAALDKQMLEPSIRRVQLQTVSFHWGLETQVLQEEYAVFSMLREAVHRQKYREEVFRSLVHTHVSAC